MNAADTAALLSLMEGGRLVRAKKGRTLDVTVPIKVVAATNQVAKLPPELKSRFAMRKLNPYDTAQYRTVVKGVLVRREGINPELAGEIAEKLKGRSQDVRDAVRVARLSPQLGIDKAKFANIFANELFSTPCCRAGSYSVTSFQFRLLTNMEFDCFENIRVCHIPTYEPSITPYFVRNFIICTITSLS